MLHAPSRSRAGSAATSAMDHSAPPRPAEREEQRRSNGHAHHVIQRAGEQDHQRLDHHHHFAADRPASRTPARPRPGRARQTAAPPGSTPNGCDRPISATAMPTNPAPCQRNRGAVCAASPITVLIASEARQPARDQHGDDGDPHRVDAGIDRRRFRMAKGADLVPQAGAPDQHPDPERRRPAPGRTTRSAALTVRNPRKPAKSAGVRQVGRLREGQAVAVSAEPGI